MIEQRFVCRAAMSAVEGRTVRLTFSTDDVDSFGTRFDPAGCRLQRYLAAPIVLWHHAGEAEGVPDPDCGVGVATSVARQGRAWVADVALEQGNPIADKLLRKIRNGSLYGCSIGAVIVRSHKEGDIVVVDEWELAEISLCFVPSNAAALIRRAARAAGLPQPAHATQSLAQSTRFARRSALDLAALLAALGLQEGATYDQVCQALLDNLADTDEKKAMVAAVQGMKPGSEAGGDAGGDASRAASCDGEVERQAMRNAILAKDREIADLKKKLGPTPDSDPKAWAKQMVTRGIRLTEAELIEMAEKSPLVAQRTAELLLAEKSKSGLHTRTLGPAAAGGGASGPKLGADPAAATAKSFEERRKAAEATARR